MKQIKLTVSKLLIVLLSLRFESCNATTRDWLFPLIVTISIPPGVIACCASIICFVCCHLIHKDIARTTATRDSYFFTLGRFHQHTTGVTPVNTHRTNATPTTAVNTQILAPITELSSPPDYNEVADCPKYSDLYN